MFRNFWTAHPKGAEFLCFAFLFAVLCPGSALAQSWRWAVEDVDTTGAEQTSIVADKDGNLHLAYYMTEGFGELRYAFRSAANSRWYKMTLDKHVGEFSTGIGLDSNNNPGICYTPRKMKYTHWDGLKWSIQEVDPGSGNISYHCSIKFTRDDRPRLSWFLETVYALRFAGLEEGVWKVRSVEVGAQSGKWNSLVLDDKELPHLAYSSWLKKELKYAYFDGKHWVRTVIDTAEGNPVPGPRGMGASLLLDGNGNPRISYYDLNALKYARFQGGQWVTEVIEQLPTFVDWSWKNFQSTQLFDSNGNPHISYESYMGLKHAWWDGKQWHTQMIRPSSGNSFFESFMTIDRNDNLYISFKDPADGSLKIAVGRPTQAVQTAKEGGKKDDSKN